MSCRSFICIFFLSLIALLSACSPATQVKSERFFFPPLPAEPKIEYIKSYFSDHDLKPERRGFLTEYVLGEELPQSLFEKPVDVVSNGEGLVFVADSGSRQVFALDLQEHRYTVLYRDESGQGQLAQGMPVGLSMDNEGRVFVADVLKKAVDVFDANNEYLFSITDESLDRPTAVAVDSTNRVIWVLDTANHQVVKFSYEGSKQGAFGQRGAGPEEFNYPTDIDVDENGNIYVLDSLNAKVKVFDAEGRFLREFGERGTALGSFSIPKGLAVSEHGHVYVTDSLGHKLVIFDREGGFLLRIGAKSVAQGGISPGGFYLPRGIDCDERGGVWIVDSLNRMVHNFQYLTSEYLSDYPVE